MLITVVNADDDDNDEVNHGPQVPDIARGYPKELDALAAHIEQPQFPVLFRHFLHKELYGPVDDIALDDCPVFGGHLRVFHSVIAHFYAPSDLCGAGGMYSERIRANPNWHGYARHDTVFIDVGGPAMAGLVIGRVLLFFSFPYLGKDYRCALIHWFVPVGDAVDPDTGMWVVEPELQRREPSLAIVPVQSIARGAHLIGVYDTRALPEDFHFSDTLDAFNRFFVNPYADHHMYEFLK
ncbi:hypothetical protein FB45DRAFT_1037981 [Roridomyces roridus]|uniref:Uncharacterized protein n=1 Tax=Roridomyces roridus TaxID=1738132 RepID=A0AAD7B5H4_9AGAR|nr:hypothetical protein FB45DRAFT_1037981 [Roridomyces roridus]